MTRRELARSDAFARMSPAVGELDEDAVIAALDDDADVALAVLATLTAAADARLRALARRLAAQLFVDLARRGPHRRRGATRLATVPYGAGDGDIDVDASLDAVVGARAANAAVDVAHLRLRAWTTPATAWCLLVDHSGSMAGQALAIAGLAAAAVAARADAASVAVLSFARSVVAVSALADRHDPGQVVDRVLALRGHGTTDLAAALRGAADQLDLANASRRVTVLLSDCRPTEPGDVVAAATALDELIVVAPAGDSDEAEALARASGARCATIAGPADVVPVFDAVLDRRGP